ncbi:MAG: hypothetical protein GX946_12305 [Oligosphaeraceae bacterium]|nr:hypothetical protein [Oligosphaeraceae bacterium]
MINVNTSAEHLQSQAQDIWDGIWKWLYCPRTSLIYDFITSYDEEHRLETLPTADEVRRQEPNPCGWGTGMEDSAINGGAMLSAICDRYMVTGESEMKVASQKIFDGLYACTMFSGEPGFVARSICPEDGQSVYKNSSRDQYTHLVHGLWRLWHSPLADLRTKARIQECLAAVAHFTERSVTPANDYKLLMLDGKPAPLVCQMWNLEEIAPHEACRLPMIYAAAYDVTGDGHFLEECMKYLREGLEYSCRLWHWPYLCYALLQMSCSLEVLLAVFPDGEDNSLCRKALCDAAERAQYNAMKSAREFLTAPEVEPVYMDWRMCKLVDNYGYKIPRQAFSETTREAGEAALVQMMAPDFHFTDFQKMLLKRALGCRNYEKFSSYGPIYLMSAYWRMRRLDIDTNAKNSVGQS